MIGQSLPFRIVGETVDPVSVGVIQELLVSIVREMRINLSHSAFSSVITEGHDYSCALLSPNGELVAQSEDNPAHIFPLPFSWKAIRERYTEDIHSGDVFIINDPYLGGTHLNDTAVYFPRFHEGKPMLFPAIRAHYRSETTSSGPNGRRHPLGRSGAPL